MSAPTRALSAQITRRLRADFEPIGLRVEQLTAAIEVDAFEEELLTDGDEPFDIPRRNAGEAVAGDSATGRWIVLLRS